jgi:hypothetical protein
MKTKSYQMFCERTSLSVVPCERKICKVKVRVGAEENTTALCSSVGEFDKTGARVEGSSKKI